MQGRNADIVMLLISSYWRRQRKYEDFIKGNLNILMMAAFAAEDV